MSNGVYPPVEEMQAPSATPRPDCSPPHPKLHQLPPRDDSMLPLRELGDARIPLARRSRTAFGTYAVLDAVPDLHPSILAS